MRPLAKKMVDEIRDDGLFDAAAGVAFWLLLSLPAALLAGLSAVSLLGDDLTAELRSATLEFVDRVFTSEADSLRASIDSLFDRGRPAVLSISLATAVFTLSRGFAGLVRALDTVYDIEETRNFLHTRLVAIGLAVGTLLVVAMSTALWSVGGSLDVPPVVRLLGAAVVLVLWAATIFHIGPNHHTPWRYDLPGAAFAALGWLTFSLGFAWYIRIIGAGGNDVLGATGAILLALTWMWGACVVLLIGAELNEIIASQAGVVQQNPTLVERVRRVRGRRNGGGGSGAGALGEPLDDS